MRAKQKTICVTLMWNFINREYNLCLTLSRLTVILHNRTQKNDFIESTTQIDGLIEHLCFLFFFSWMKNKTRKQSLNLFLILFPSFHYIKTHKRTFNLLFFFFFLLFKRPPILYLILNFLLCFSCRYITGNPRCKNSFECNNNNNCLSRFLLLISMVQTNTCYFKESDNI